MNKINFRFSLIQARFPALHQEAQEKLAGGVERKDIMADWLNELVCRRMSVFGKIITEIKIDKLDFSAIIFRFTLLQARFPDLYQEAQEKLAGGMEKKDIVADWLNELICRRMSDFSQPENIIAPETNEIDFSTAANIMDSLD